MKLVNPNGEPHGDFEIKVNNVNKKGRIASKLMTIVQITNLKVTNGEIRISRVNGYISMIEVEIESKPDKKDREPIKEIQSTYGFTV